MSFSGLLWTTGTLVALSTLCGPPAHADVYDTFNAFAQTSYGAARDSLIYEWFGQDLEPPTDWWEYVSETSAVVGFSTNLPALTHVEFGTTTAYGQATSTTDRRYYQHLHHLVGLTPGDTYHYRAVMEDEGGLVTYGVDRTITPVAIPEAIRIPAQLPGPPYVLSDSSAYYLVTDDIVAPWRAFDITANGVVLDLGGHDVTYNVEYQLIDGTWLTYQELAAFGVRSVGADSFRVHNGTIRQGAGANGGHPEASVGFNPIYFWEGSGVEVSGMVVEYTGSQMVGVYAHWQKSDNEVHHNVFVDRGSDVTNRHGIGSSALGFVGPVIRFWTHHNLVKRTRQNGLNGSMISDNEIYIDSFVTNSFGIPALYSDREASGNKIFGTGYHVVGIGWGSDNWWHDNFIHLVGQGPDYRYAEYGNQESLNGLRLTQYASEELRNSLVERNLVIISGGACSGDGACTQARGLQYHSDPYVIDNILRENTIKVVMNDEVTQAASVVTQGLFSRCGTEAPLFYVDNTLISNIANVRIGDYAGIGCNHHFLGNEMIRVGDRDDYRTLMFDYPVATIGHFFYDSMFDGGASYDLVEFSHSGQELSVGWTLDVWVTDGVDPIADASVTVTDVNEVAVATGMTNEQGLFSTPLVAYQETSAGRTYSTPMVVRAQYGAAQETRSIPLEDKTEITLVLLDPTGIAPEDLGGPLQLSAVPVVMSHETRFRWGQGLRHPATLEIYDIRGRAVRQFRLPSGSNGVTWNGRDDRGENVGSGVYLARILGRASTSVCRVIVLR